MSGNSKARSTGFTLIELLVVVFIIGILVAATLTIIPKVQRAVYGAQTSAQLSAIANAIQQYYNDFRSYPGPLPNSQLCSGFDTTPVPPYSTSATPQPLTVVATNPFSNTDYYPSNLQINCITGAQNLVLGLLGGLEMVEIPGPPVTFTFVYNPQDIFSDGLTAAPKGCASLNVANPKRQQAYIQVKSGDLSTPRQAYVPPAPANSSLKNPGYTGTGASFAFRDQLPLAPQDAMIPVFLDKYSDPMPILYYRTNVGGTAIVGFRGFTTINTTPLTDPNNTTVNETPQYDLLQNITYTSSRIGTKGDGTQPTDTYHGLNGITGASNTGMLLVSSSTPPVPPVDTIDAANGNGVYLPTNPVSSQGAANGLAYFKDPTLNNNSYDNVTSNVHLGIPRQKDGFVLISAGPDRLYGTHDDVIYPGPLVPPSN